jgi:hypothetical protein
MELKLNELKRYAIPVAEAERASYCQCRNLLKNILMGLVDHNTTSTINTFRIPPNTSPDQAPHAGCCAARRAGPWKYRHAKSAGRFDGVFWGYPAV